MSADWRGPSRNYLKLRRVEVVVVAGGCAIAVAVAAIVVGVNARAWVVVAAIVAAGIVALFVVERRFASWGYVERGEDLLVKRGVLFSRLSVIPYGRMQFIDVTASPFERLFGIATVRMHTAAAATDARIVGLEKDDAAQLRDKLAQLGEAQAAGL